MNNYPIWWDSAVTVYNKYEDATTHKIEWYRTVLTGCFWKNQNEKLSVGETVLDTNSIVCRVPAHPMYKDKFKWITLPEDERMIYFTFGVGDILVRGEVDDEISEYHSGNRSSDLISKYKKYGECFVVEICTNNTGAGRCNEHYKVKGV